MREGSWTGAFRGMLIGGAIAVGCGGASGDNGSPQEGVGGTPSSSAIMASAATGGPDGGNGNDGGTGSGGGGGTAGGSGGGGGSGSGGDAGVASDAGEE